MTPKKRNSRLDERGLSREPHPLKLMKPAGEDDEAWFYEEEQGLYVCVEANKKLSFVSFMIPRRSLRTYLRHLDEGEKA